MFPLPEAWTYEEGLPSETRIPGFRDSPSQLWDMRGYRFFLHTLVWVGGVSISPRESHEYLSLHRQDRGAGL